jgi:hypothetical protein
MPTIVRLLLVALLVASAALPAPAQEPSAPLQEAPTIHDLGFLVGCWEGELGSSGRRVRETWSALGGQMMLVTGQMFGQGSTTFFEFARVEARGWEVVYVPYPSGRESVPFRLIETGEGRAVFENPGHDFPQRIVYRLDDGGRLVATASGGERSQEFSMAPVSCRPAGQG